MSISRLPPVPTLELPEWSDDVRRAWTERASRAESLSRGAGAGRRFGELVAEARRVLLAQDVDVLGARNAERRFVRAVVTAWVDEPSLLAATFTQPVARVLSMGSWSRLAAVTVARLLTEHFDRLDGIRPGLFAAVRDLAWTALGQQPPSRHHDTVDALRTNHAYLFEATGPARLATELLARGQDARAWLRSGHLTAFADTRWGQIVRDVFYLECIRVADPAQGDHRFLTTITDEVMVRQRTDATDEERLYFGHRVLTALTAKTTRHPSQAWIETVLAIGGDPRLVQTHQWQTWWSRVPEENRARAVSWMRGVDLNVFLNAVAHYAEATANETMTRMLERRARFLSGLYEQDRINDLRLILGDDIRRWITRNARVRLVDEARLEGTTRQDTAVVYVDCGDFFLVEGSHNFKLHVYVRGAPERIADRRIRSFSIAELREELPDRHRFRHGADSYDAYPHLGFAWVPNTLEFLRRHGVRLDERALLTPNDYAELSRRRVSGRY